MTVDQVLARIRAYLALDAETEHDVLEEIRFHLEQAIETAEQRGIDQQTALAQAAARFGVEQVGRDLQATHVGWGTADGIIAAALPVVCALVLRWLVFAPDGTAVQWQEILARPTFWGVSLAMLIVPLLKFRRRRYALVTWGVFWVLSITFVMWPALRW